MAHLADGELSGLGVFARRFEAAGQALGIEFHVNTDTLGDQVYTSIAYDSQGGFLVAYSGQGWENIDGVYARKYDPEGTAEGGPFLVNSTTAGLQQIPSVVAASSGYVVMFQGAGPDDADGMFARRFGSRPSAAGTDPIQVLEDAPPTSIDLFAVFEDPENVDSQLKDSQTLRRLELRGLTCTKQEAEEISQTMHHCTVYYTAP